MFKGDTPYKEYEKLWHRAKMWKEGRELNAGIMEDTAGAPVWEGSGVVARWTRPSSHNLLMTGVGNGKILRV